MKLYGKELDDELEKRKQSKEDRRNKKLTIRDAAKLKGISSLELISYERGEDVCPHEKYIDQVGGFPVPKFILKICAKCRTPDGNSMEKVNESNMKRVYEVYKRSMEKLSEGLFVKKQE